MLTGDAVSGDISPKIQNAGFNRLGTFDGYLPLNMYSYGATIIDFEISYLTTEIPWLKIEGFSTLGYLDPVNNAQLPVEIFDTALLPNGTHKAVASFNFVPLEGNTYNVIVEFYLGLSGVEVGSITTDKTNYNVLYNRETNMLSGDTHVQIINNTSLYPLTFETIGTLFKEETTTEVINLVEDPIFPFSTNSDLPISGTVVVSCKIRKDGVFLRGFNITLTVLENSEIIVTPESLEFTLRKGFNETKVIPLTLNNPLNKAFTISKPSWLNLSSSSGSSTETIMVETENSEIFAVDELTGIIVISYDSKTIEIPVKLRVIKFIDINTQEYNFCLDDVILKVFKMTEIAKFVRVTIQMKFTTADGETEIESVYQIPYFNNQAKTDIGVKIQNYFPIYQNHLFNANQINFDNRLIYKAASVQLIVEEIDINYTVLHSLKISDLDFYAGSRPVQFPLFTNFPVRRKYSGSTFFFSYLANLVAPSYFTSLGVTGHPTGDKEVHAVMLEEGDILEDTVLKLKLGVDLIPFPNVESQVVLQWLNNNLVPSGMIFSGNYNIEDAFDQLNDSFQILGQKYDTTETQKLTISTGFILKEETQLIKEIIKSKLAFIRIEGEIYKVLPSSQKLAELERQKNLINYELEFIIVK